MRNRVCIGAKDSFGTVSLKAPKHFSLCASWHLGCCDTCTKAAESQNKEAQKKRDAEKEQETPKKQFSQPQSITQKGVHTDLLLSDQECENCFFAALSPFLVAEFQALIARTALCAIRWRSPKNVNKKYLFEGGLGWGRIWGRIAQKCCVSSGNPMTLKCQTMCPANLIVKKVSPFRNPYKTATKGGVLVFLLDWCSQVRTRRRVWDLWAKAHPQEHAC